VKVVVDDYIIEPVVIGGSMSARLDIKAVDAQGDIHADDHRARLAL